MAYNGGGFRGYDGSSGPTYDRAGYGSSSGGKGKGGSFNSGKGKGGGKGFGGKGKGKGKGSGAPPEPAPFPTEPPYSAYLGNFDYNATESDVQELVESGLPGTGVVSVRVMVDRLTGRGRGFGYVEFADPEGLTSALQTLDGVDFRGRTLRVNVAAGQRATAMPTQLQPPHAGGQQPPVLAAADAAPANAGGEGGNSNGAGAIASGPEPCYFFELNGGGGGQAQVVLMEVAVGVSFTEDELPDKVHRLLHNKSYAVCKVVAAVAPPATPPAAAAAGHGEYENVNVAGGGLALATEAPLKAAAPYGADVAATTVFGRIGVCCRRDLVGKPMDPSRLCDLVAPGASAEAFFVPSMGARSGEAMGAAQAGLAAPPYGFNAAVDRTVVVGRYVDGKHAMANFDKNQEQEQQPEVPLLPGVAAAEGSLAPLEPTASQVEAEVSRASLKSGGSKPRDPFLRGDSLAARVKAMALVTTPSATLRLSLPPPPLGSTDIRVYGAKCLESQMNEHLLVMTNSSGVGSDPCLCSVALTTAELDHADPTMANYKLKPDATEAKLSLVRPHLRPASSPAAPAPPAPESLSPAPQGYPVYTGLHFCGGLACDFQLVLSEFPPSDDGAVAVPWDSVESVQEASSLCFAVLEASRHVASSVNAACHDRELRALETFKTQRAAATEEASKALANMTLLGEGAGLKAIATKNKEDAAAAAAAVAEAAALAEKA